MIACFQLFPAFEILEQAVEDQLHLAHLDYSKPVYLAADASTQGLGGSLENICRDKEGTDPPRACIHRGRTIIEKV